MRIIALLDRPNSHSMAMRGFVAECQGEPRIYGVSGLRGTPIGRGRLQALIDAGDAIAPDHETKLEREFENPAVWWLGREFWVDAQKLELEPYFDVHSKFSAGGNSFGVGEAQKIMAALEDWLAWALACVVKTGDTRIADLMVSTIPQHLDTQAALWWSTEPERRDRELAFIAQADGGACSAGIDSELLDRISRRCNQIEEELQTRERRQKEAARRGILLRWSQGTAFGMGGAKLAEAEQLVLSIGRQPGIHHLARQDPVEALEIFREWLKPFHAAVLRVGRLLSIKKQKSLTLHFLRDDEQARLDQEPELLSSPSAATSLKPSANTPLGG